MLNQALLPFACSTLQGCNPHDIMVQPLPVTAWCSQPRHCSCHESAQLTGSFAGLWTPLKPWWSPGTACVHTPTWLVAVQVCAPREMVVEQTWREEEDGTVIVLFHTTRHRYAREAPRTWFGSWWQPVRAQVNDVVDVLAPCMLLQPPA